MDDSTAAVSDTNEQFDSVAAQKRDEKTPLKQPVKLSNSSVFIPSPFKRNLYWPGEDDSKKGKKIRLREKIPCAITSKSWREYHEKKEMKKIEMEKEKEQRAKERELKKQMKEKNKITKKKKNAIAKPGLDITSSEDTETEVNYAESDDSIEMEVDNLPIQSKKTINSDSTDSDDAALITHIKKYSKGDHVIIKYEGEYFPGLVENVQGNTFEISTMTFSVGNTFRWPEKPDKIWYHKSDVVESISKPVLSNKRGFYCVKEMNKYLPFTT